MKKHRGKPVVQINPDIIAGYTEELTTPESENIQQLIKESDEELQYIDMISGRLVGQLLKTLIQISGAKRILEIGTFTGYSALTMAEVLPHDGEIITMEMNFRYMELAKSFFKRFDHREIIKLIEGNALQNLDKVGGKFDMVYLDGDKARYPEYFDRLLPMINTGGLLIADNVLWDGQVLDPQDEKSKIIDEFNRKVAADERVEQVLLPIRDGVNVIRKK